ncbi:MAG: tetratricopeptide repeat protein, partial [Flavobacteriales bacterium]|nr:tetratricopeptide repeat protein [Flavobacteriales bacterium]
YLGALKDYNLCIKQNDQYAEAYYNRGILLARQRNFGLAKKDLEKAMESGLATDGVHKQYANVLFQMRLYDEALEIYQDLSSKNATAELDIKIGNCYFQKQHLDHALKSYFLAVSKDSLSPEAYYNLGNVFAQMDSIESRSCGYWKRALDLGMYSAKKNIDSFCGISNKKIP